MHKNQPAKSIRNLFSQGVKSVHLMDIQIVMQVFFMRLWFLGHPVFVFEKASCWLTHYDQQKNPLDKQLVLTSATSPTHQCTIVPKEVCVLKFNTPKPVSKPLLTKWCLDTENTEERSSEIGKSVCLNVYQVLVGCLLNEFCDENIILDCYS